MSDSKNSVAWELLFEKFKIAEAIEKNGFYEIKSKEINEFREARLMTKFDYKSQLPQIFAENNLSILPISRGSYLISTFETYQNFENNDVEIIKIDFPNYIESIDYNNITSESTALHCAYISGILHNFTKEEELKPTVSGRMSSSSFDFNINSQKGVLKIIVENSQIEIDGGFEGIESLILIEAKNSISKDFLIRQVFYPYRLWSNKIKKKVRSLFLTYTNGIFHFREYEFADPNHYNSIKLIKEKKYIIGDGGINNELIQKKLFELTILKEQNIPFPQANSFERVINLCELLNEHYLLSSEYITNNFDFDSRQTNYYADAGRYLGLIDKKREDNQIRYFLTIEGKKLFELSIFERQIKFIELILSHLPFNKTLKLYYSRCNVPDKHAIVAIMKKSNLYNIYSDETFYRRSSTIISWINWILEQIEE